MKKTIVAGIVFSLLLGGCSSFSEKKEVKVTNDKDYEAIAFNEQLKLNNNIEEIAKKALEAQRIRQQVENANSIQLMDNDKIREAEWQISHVPIGMERELQIDWNGAPEPLLNLLADHCDYDIDFEGKPYPIAKDIAIYPERKNIKRLIDEVDRQAKGYIKAIDIYENLRFIKVIYQEQ